MDLLSNVTVCDPAAGSGAFEVGMLHVLHDILDNLYHRHNAPKDLPEWDDFEQKKSIIARSLYGVEVKEWAVWINQLRLWLTLFIDMPDDYKNSLQPLLPSLNFKVRQGDSLVQRIGNKLFPGSGARPSLQKYKTQDHRAEKGQGGFLLQQGRFV
ncbi:MAG: DNA methyltransferase [Balneolaceae bacterium]|nr:DNA methyltransferase [Balneolaceae bacterium]